MAGYQDFFPGVEITEHPCMRTLEDGTIQWLQRTVPPPHIPSVEYWKDVEAVRGFNDNDEVERFTRLGGGIVAPMHLNLVRGAGEPFMVAPVFVADEDRFVRNCLGMDLPLDDLMGHEFPGEGNQR